MIDLYGPVVQPDWAYSDQFGRFRTDADPIGDDDISEEDLAKVAMGEAWDDTTGTLTITVHHRGPVEIELT